MHHIINVPNYIQPCTLEAAYQVASNLRQDDLEEVVEGHGIDPIIDMPLSTLSGSCVSFTVPDGRIAGLAGIESDGRIWMLCTDAIDDFPITFAREAKRFIDSRSESMLWNFAYKKNKTHLKLLKFLGFELLDEVPYGPNQLPFIPFVKWIQ